MAQALTKLLQDRADPGQGLKPDDLVAARAKQVGEFEKATQGASKFSLARAIFQAAAADVDPTPADLVFYDGLLRGRQPDPLYIETLLLRRLADRARGAGPGTEWPSESVRVALEAAQRGEPVYARPRSFSLLRPWIDRAARQRHLGEILLFSPGFAPEREAESRLRRASEFYYAVSPAQEIVERSWDLRDEALAFLPSALGLLDSNRHLDATWQSAIQATIELDHLLFGANRLSRSVSLETAVTELLSAIAPIRSRMEFLEERLGADPANHVGLGCQGPDRSGTIAGG